MQEVLAAGAVIRLDGAGALAGAVMSSLDNPAGAAEIGERGRALAMAKRGTADSVVEQILAAADESVPDPPHTLEARLTLGPLASIWKAGNSANIAIALTRRARLETPVISVGALAMGGAG